MVRRVFRIHLETIESFLFIYDDSPAIMSQPDRKTLVCLGHQRPVHGRRRAALLAIALSLLAGRAGAADPDIVIGASLPLGGFNAAVGQEVLNVANAYFDAVNKAGGIEGRRLRLEVLDDRFDPQVTRQNVRKLADDEKIVAVFNCLGTSSCSEAAPVANAARVPLVGGIAGGGPMRTQPGRYAFNVRASTEQEIAHMVAHTGMLGQKNLALVYQDDPFGKSGQEAARGVFASAGVKPLAELSIKLDGANANQVAAALAQQSQPVQGVIVVASAPATVRLITEARKTGVTAQFYNLAAQANPKVVHDLGEYRSGVVFTTLVPNPWQTHQPIVREYQGVMAASPDKGNLSYLGMEVFINAQVLVDGLRRAGRAVSRESLRDALETMGERRYGPLVMRYTPSNHTGGQYVSLTIIGRNGRFVE